MINSVIETIFYAIELSDKDFVIEDIAYGQDIKEIEKLENEISQTLSESQKDLFDRYSDIKMNIEMIMCKTYFRKGFKYSFNLISESLK
ncbi:hypothetical protein MKC91_10385 [[Clostridium] innocuum]|jgi:hypothetical protein|nr:hypothetical protein [[Clostridium] innocuum]MCR0413786.1 hypothetical protein [[Clostridium] innocuum]MCR0534688.1 hypothetical protein [[Clostridium] innocuum]MCR0538810.1 hypothetical protein [[Clostridium] innocuum]MDU1119289.1 hypothetical protein [Erysipelotrichaceae bacterium]